MFQRQRATAVALSVAVVFGLCGCSLLAPPGPAPLTGTAACALGKTWKANMEDLSAQLLAQLQAAGVPVTEAVVTGDLTMDWSTEGHVVLGNDYVVTIKATPAADQVLTVVETHSGDATGAAYINGEVAIPRKWDDSNVKVAVVADSNGAAVDAVPFGIPVLVFDDSVGLELTCASGELTTHPRGSKITQKWTS